MDANLPASRSLTKHAATLALGLALVLFLVLGLYQLDLPGLHYDEAKEAGLNAMQLALGQPVTAFRDATLLGRYPLMVQDYIGALNVYLAVPFLKVGGITVPALRMLPLSIGALTLVLAWFLARRLGGPLAASVTVLLMAVNPTFVFWSRQGIFVTNLTACILIGSLIAALRWWDRRRPVDLWLTVFLWGLGLYAKLLFVWAIGASLVLIAVALLVRRGRRSSGAVDVPAGKPSPARSAAVWVGALVAFAIPLIPLLIFNLRTGGTLTSLFGNLDRSYYGVSNAAYLPNLVTRLGQIWKLLVGDHLWYIGSGSANPVAPWAAAALLLMAVATWGLRRGRIPAWSLAFATLALIVAQSAFTVSDLFITHYALLLPLIPLFAGLAVAAIAQGGKGARIAGAVAVVIALAWGALDLDTTIKYHGALTSTGGLAAHSEALGRVGEYIENQGYASVVALDWGMEAPLQFLTTGRLNPTEVFGYGRLDAPDAGFDERVAPYVKEPGAIFIAHVPEQTVFKGRLEALRARAAAFDRILEIDAEVYERFGGPLFVLYRVALPHR